MLLFCGVCLISIHTIFQQRLVMNFENNGVEKICNIFQIHNQSLLKNGCYCSHK